jgi:hypothetical protein
MWGIFKEVRCQQIALVHELENHSDMFRLIFVAIFREHQYILQDMDSIRTQLCQL